MCLNRNAWTNVLEAWGVIGDFKHEHNTRHRHSRMLEGRRSQVARGMASL